MTRRVVSLTLDSLADLPAGCRSCVYWELEPGAQARVKERTGDAFEKEAWLSDTLLQWGSCGQLAYVDDVPVGFMMYAPPAYVPRATAFPTSPVSADAVLLMTGRVVEEYRGAGIGKLLFQSAAKDLISRDVRAIEAFGAARAQPGHCVLPADHLRAVGFKTVRPHPVWPRLRLDLKTAVTWRGDVEVAIERLIGSIAPDIRRPRRLSPVRP